MRLVGKRFKASAHDWQFQEAIKKVAIPNAESVARVAGPALLNYASAFVAQWIERSPPKG